MNLQQKNETNIFPVRTEQRNSKIANFIRHYTLGAESSRRTKQKPLVHWVQALGLFEKCVEVQTRAREIRNYVSM